MTEIFGKARKVGNVNSQKKGDMVLYHLDPPVEFYKGNDFSLTTEYVILSTLNNGYARETLAFPSDNRGNIVSWSEIDGIRNCLDKNEVLAEMGYETIARKVSKFLTFKLTFY